VEVSRKLQSDWEISLEATTVTAHRGQKAIPGLSNISVFYWNIWAGRRSAEARKISLVQE
jgi:hypothetical protein